MLSTGHELQSKVSVDRDKKQMIVWAHLKISQVMKDITQRGDYQVIIR